MWKRKKPSRLVLFWLLGLLLFSPLSLSSQDFGPSLWQSGELELLLDSVSSLNPETMVLNANEMSSMLSWLVTERNLRTTLIEEWQGLKIDLIELRQNFEMLQTNRTESIILYEQQSQELKRERTRKILFGVGGVLIGIIIGGLFI